MKTTTHKVFETKIGGYKIHHDTSKDYISIHESIHEKKNIIHYAFIGTGTIFIDKKDVKKLAEGLIAFLEETTE